MEEERCELCKEGITLGCGDYHIVNPTCASCEGSKAKDKFYHFHCLISAYASKTENENIKLRAKLEFAEKIILNLGKES